MDRAGLAAALDQRHHGALAGRAGLAALGERTIPALRRRLGLILVAEIGLVGLDDLARPTKAARIVGRGVHRLADAVRQEPSRLVGQAEHAVRRRLGLILVAEIGLVGLDDLA